MQAPSALSIDGLTICATRHGQTRHGQGIDLVRDLSLTLHRGEILALVGASGSGKSMTCAGAQDVLPPGVTRRAGRVLIDGTEVPPAALRGRGIATPGVAG